MVTCTPGAESQVFAAPVSDFGRPIFAIHTELTSGWYRFSNHDVGLRMPCRYPIGSEQGPHPWRFTPWLGVKKRLTQHARGIWFHFYFINSFYTGDKLMINVVRLQNY